MSPTPFLAVCAPALRVLALLSVMLGLAYPLLVTALAQSVFPHQANGSLVQANGRVIGSSLIGQSFTQPNGFWGRPSATAEQPYQAMASGGSNWGPSHPELAQAVAARIAALRAAGPVPAGPVPLDLLTASASGLDPHISLAAALYQVPRVAQARGLDPAQLAGQVRQLAEAAWFDDGNPRLRRVNVLALNQLLGQP